jgi:dihydrofolate reductase
MNLSIIAAIGQNRELGFKNKLLWHIPADLKRFKTITSGHTVIMGRRTFESIGKKPLSNRKNIILTQQKGFTGQDVLVADTITAALNFIDPAEETFILGGALVYEQFIPYTNKMYLTIIQQAYRADAFFPDFERNSWEITEQIDVDNDERAGVNYSFMTFVRLSQ